MRQSALPLLPFLVLAFAALQATPARADMWRYVDAQGVSHFSAAQIDKRYKLLFRGAESFSAGNNKGAGTGLDASALRPYTASAGSPKQLTYFDVSPNYKAVKHLLREASETHGIDYELLQAVIATESGFNATAVSPKGAVGLMQLIPPTAERYGVKAEKDAELALAAYNAGEGAVQRAGNKIPNYPETKNYVKTVMQLYTLLKPSTPAATTSTGRVRMEMMGGTPIAALSSALPD